MEAVPALERSYDQSWRQPAAMEGVRAYSFGTLPAAAGLMMNIGEVAVHGWD